MGAELGRGLGPGRRRADSNPSEKIQNGQAAIGGAVPRPVQAPAKRPQSGQSTSPSPSKSASAHKPLTGPPPGPVKQLSKAAESSPSRSLSPSRSPRQGAAATRKPMFPASLAMLIARPKPAELDINTPGLAKSPPRAVRVGTPGPAGVSSVSVISRRLPARSSDPPGALRGRAAPGGRHVAVLSVPVGPPVEVGDVVSPGLTTSPDGVGASAWVGLAHRSVVGIEPVVRRSRRRRRRGRRGRSRPALYHSSWLGR